MEYANPGGSSKDRVAKQVLLDAHKSGELTKGGSVYEGTSGSTGISLALLCKGWCPLQHLVGIVENNLHITCLANHSYGILLPHLPSRRSSAGEERYTSKARGPCV